MPTEAANFTEQDAQAVGAVRNGDADRYRELVERHERRVYAVAWARLGDATLAEEATQEAFIRAYRRLRLLGDGAKFAGWIASIARHVAINFGLRHRRELNKRERWALEQAPEREDHPHATEADPPCTPEMLRQTLAELPAAHRECLVLFYLEGKSGAEAATVLGISEAALRVRLHRARAALRERLEERLADSLGKLGPGRTLVPAIMAAVLSASSAKAATAGGAVGVGVGANLLATFGKVIPFAALLPLFQVIASLPGLLFASWIGRMERRNFRDAEGFRSQMHKGFYRSFLWGFPLMIVVILFPIYFAQALGGVRAMYGWFVSFLVVVTLVAARALTINRSPFSVGSFAYCCVITVGVIALALGWLPAALSSLPMIVATILFTFMLGHRRPTRMDYNLFLRAGQGLLTAPPTPALPPLKKSLDRASLLNFARFLGSRWLAVGYRWETRGLALRLPPVKIRFVANMLGTFLPMSRRCSRLVLRDDGTVVAHLGENDAADLSATNPKRAAAPDELELQVALAAEHAMREFRAGNSAAAERAVGELPESEVFVVPPARAKSTRWLRVWLGVAVTVMAAAMVMNWQLSQSRHVSGRHLRAVSFSEAEVVLALARLAEARSIASNALRQADATFWLAEVLPPKPLFPSNAWEALREHLWKSHFSKGGNVAQRVDRLLGTPDLLRAVANGWLGLDDFSLTAEEIRGVIREASDATRKRWFVPADIAVANHCDGRPAGYSVLDTESVARRLQCLRRFGCLDVVDGIAAIEPVLKHQVLSASLPAGRRVLPFPKLLHGTFLTYGQDPIRDTYYALVILDCLDALDRVDREACVEGILRFHHGRGRYGPVKPGDGFVIFGDSRDTFWAFESLRMLDALDRVKDLPRWQFRPMFTSQKAGQPREVGQATWSEIEAWVCQQRLERFLRERSEHPQTPARSLLVP